MRPIVLLLLAFAAAAPAAERKPFVSSFDRLRVEGPYIVTVTTGGSPGARMTGDARALDGVDVRQDGTTLVVRRAVGAWGEGEQASSGTPVTVALSTPTLSSASLLGAGAVTVTAMKGARVDVSVAGTGTLAIAAVDGDQVNAQLVGNGQITLGGRAAKARLLVNGAGTIHADTMTAADVVVRLDGPGETTARARYTADVVNSGLGRVTIAGTPKCRVKADAGGPVTCGAAAGSER